MLAMAGLAEAARTRVLTAFQQVQGTADRLAIGNIVGVDDLPAVGSINGHRTDSSPESEADGPEGFLAHWGEHPTFGMQSGRRAMSSGS